MAHSFTAPNGITYTIEVRYVSTGWAKFSRKPVWDLHSTAIGTRHYDEAGIIKALSARLGLPIEKCERAIDRIKNGWVEPIKPRAAVPAPLTSNNGLPIRPLTPVA